MSWGGERGESGTGTNLHTAGSGLAVECSGTGTTLHKAGRGLAGECSGTGTTLHTAVSPSPGDEPSTDAEARRKFAQCAASLQSKQKGEISANYYAKYTVKIKSVCEAYIEIK